MFKKLIFPNRNLSVYDYKLTMSCFLKKSNIKLDDIYNLKYYIDTLNTNTYINLNINFNRSISNSCSKNQGEIQVSSIINMISVLDYIENEYSNIENITNTLYINDYHFSNNDIINFYKYINNIKKYNKVDDYISCKFHFNKLTNSNLANNFTFEIYNCEDILEYLNLIIKSE